MQLSWKLIDRGTECTVQHVHPWTPVERRTRRSFVVEYGRQRGGKLVRLDVSPANCTQKWPRAKRRYKHSEFAVYVQSCEHVIGLSSAPTPVLNCYTADSILILRESLHNNVEGGWDQFSLQNFNGLLRRSGWILFHGAVEWFRWQRNYLYFIKAALLNPFARDRYIHSEKIINRLLKLYMA